MKGEDEKGARRADRQQIVAALAPPVQHEVNNLLTVVLATLEALKRNAPEGAAQRQVDRIGLASRRLDEVVRAFLTLARRPLPDTAPTDLAGVVRRLEPLLRLVLGSRLELALELPDGLPEVLVDRAGLDSGLVILARDAVERLPRGGRFEVVLQAGPPGVQLLVSGLPPGPPVAAIAEAAGAVGGAFECAETEGGGTEARLGLPAAPGGQASP